MIHRLITTWNKTNLMKRIAIGIVLGVILALIFPKATGIGLLGEFFVGGLRAIAPLLVFALVANALSQHQKGTETNMKMELAKSLVTSCSRSSTTLSMPCNKPTTLGSFLGQLSLELP